MLDSDGWVPGRGIQWVLIGDRGAKKHLYTERLSKLLDVPHISMGTLVRQELNPRSSLYKQIANAVNEGKLVPDEVIFALLSKRLEEGYYRGENGFILDGIPRTRMQAEIVDQIVDIDLVVNFKCANENLVKHNLGTESSSACQEYLSLSNSIPMRNLNMQLPDERLKSSTADAEQSKSLEDYYRKQNKLIDFQVKAAPGETWKGLLAALHLQHINAVSSSQKLTA
ncbi:PREDICTED: probable adenylate kinase 7, mitochondrial [Prunus mume]|uniref:adenylate kinase n=1 Tax=Prunus mume TaxID=102107 RepID=A0ABM0NX77_PRUMU|nr:PREDICTED: probable adenylate kinase 7, mitochondrial [Prunus mume]